MSDLRMGAGGAMRAADVLLRSTGGRRVMLRVPSPAMAGDVTEQLGIVAPTFHDVVLAPVVFRRARAVVTEGKSAKWELLVSASCVEALVGDLAFASPSVLFATAYGVVCDDELLEVESATAEQALGEPYVYRLVVRAPLAQMA